MKLRFLADNDLRSSIRNGIIQREPSIVIVSAQEARLDGVRDPEVLRLASALGLMLISHDENSMPGHFRQFLSAANHSPGVAIVPQKAPTAAVIESILILWLASEADEWRDRLVWLPF